MLLTSISLERRVAARNQQRFYTIRVVKTLFGSWAMVREWGRIGQPGTVRETWFETEGSLDSFKITKKRLGPTTT